MRAAVPLVLHLALLSTFGAGGVAAAANYSYVASDRARDEPASFATLDHLLNGIKNNQNFFSFAIDLRGLTGQLDAFDDGQTFIQLVIPSLGIDTQFVGDTRDEAFELVRRFLTQGNNAARIQREQARTSPFDPVAGNPTSLMARAVALDFYNAFSAFATNIVDGSAQIAQAGAGVPAGAAPAVFRPSPGIGAFYGHFRDQGQTAQTLAIPLSLTVRSDLDPRRQFAITLPVAVSDVEGARTWSAGLGASLRLPVTRPWALTGALGYSLAGASDLGSRAQIVSTSVTSSYQLRADFADVAIGNMIGYYKTISTKVGGVSTNPDIANTVFRNGVLLSRPAPAWLGFGRSVEYTFVNTHYRGTELYLRTYNELGIAVGTNKRADSVRSHLQAGLTYLFSSKTKGVVASVGYWF